MTIKSGFDHTFCFIADGPPHMMAEAIRVLKQSQSETYSRP